MKKSRKNRGRKSQMMLAGLGLCMALGTPVRGMAVLRSVETAAERTATASDAVENIAVLAADEEIWGADGGDMSFLSGRTGDGTKEKPYQITTKEHLIGLAVLASMGMEVGSGEGTYPGNYKGAWFELGKNIDLGGMNWIPIGLSHWGGYAGRKSIAEGHTAETEKLCPISACTSRPGTLGDCSAQWRTRRSQSSR
ncbi:MAG: hypothetical protein ACLTFJ_10845 [Clostridium sp.]